MRAIYVNNKMDINNHINEEIEDEEYLDTLYNEINGYDDEDLSNESIDFEEYDKNDKDLINAKKLAKKISFEENCVQHVNNPIDNKYIVSDWYDELDTVASYENGIRIG